MNFLKRLLLIVAMSTCLLTIAGSATGNVTTVNTIVYHQIREFNLGDIPGIGRMKISENGSRIIFSCSSPKSVYTINSDGSNLIKIFDYNDVGNRPPYISPFIDIDVSGSRIMWTDGVGEIYVANADGSGRQAIANNIPYNNATIGPNIPVSPRMTPDGSTIYFASTSGSVDVAGVWRVSYSGGLAQIFSYRQLAQFTGYTWDIYWGNYAFNHDFDISDDGSKIVFGTFSCTDAKGRVIGHDGSFHILSEYAPANDGGLIISGDGSRVITNAWHFPERNPVFAINFADGQKMQVVEDAGGSPVIFGSILHDGSKVITQGSHPISHLDTYGRGRYDLVTSPHLRVDGAHPFYYAGVGNTISMTADGMRFCFPTLKLFGFSSQSQIWVADINPDGLNGAPSISSITLSPIYIVEQGGSASTFSADLGAHNAIGNLTFHGLWQGKSISIFYESHLFDDARFGDQTANDGMYVNNRIGTAATANVTISPYSVRFSTGIRQYVTAVDVAPFFVLQSAPSGSAPVITSIDPSAAPAGSEVNLNGNGFNPNSGQNIVIFGNHQAYVTGTSATQLRVLVPANLTPGAYQVTVSANGQTSNVFSFTVEGGSPNNLKPPRNLTAGMYENSTILFWDAPEGVTHRMSEKMSAEISEIEPNDSPGEAQLLSGDSPLIINGNIETGDTGTIDDGYDDIEDLFLVNLASPGLTIRLDQFNPDLDLYLYDATGSVMYDAALNATAGAPETLEDSQLESGSYLIGVSIYDPDPQGSDQSPYVLTITGDFSDEPGPSRVISYNIYRSTATGAMANGEMIATLPGHVLDYQDVLAELANYHYQVSAVYAEGESGPSNEATAYFIGVDEDHSGIPGKFALMQNYPNPFNPGTTIRYEIPKNSFVDVSIYNIKGERVKSLVQRSQDPGIYMTHWSGENDAGHLVAGGIYIFILKAGEFRESKKMIFLK